MTPNSGFISVREIAARHDLNPATAHNIINRMEIPKEDRVIEGYRAKLASFVRVEHYQELIVHFQAGKSKKSKIDVGRLHRGVFGTFYALQLEATLDPNRIKFGFATSMRNRLYSYQTSLPYHRVLKEWRCKSSWEHTVLDFVASNATHVVGEIFHVENIDRAMDDVTRLFDMMGTKDLWANPTLRMEASFGRQEYEKGHLEQPES